MCFQFTASAKPLEVEIGVVVVGEAELLVGGEDVCIWLLDMELLELGEEDIREDDFLELVLSFEVEK